MKMTDLDHNSGRCWGALIVFAVPPGPAGPRIRALYHPAFAHGREARAAKGPGLHFDSPAWPIVCQPSVERMIMILGITKDRFQAWIVVWTDLREQCRRGGSIVDLGTRDQD